jgi:hypothetical protein
MSETEQPRILILDLLAFKWGRPPDMSVASEHVPLVALEDTQDILFVITLFVEGPRSEPVNRPPHQYLQLYPLFLVVEAHLRYQCYVLYSS